MNGILRFSTSNSLCLFLLFIHSRSLFLPPLSPALQEKFLERRRSFDSASRMMRRASQNTKDWNPPPVNLRFLLIVFYCCVGRFLLFFLATFHQLQPISSLEFLFFFKRNAHARSPLQTPPLGIGLSRTPLRSENKQTPSRHFFPNQWIYLFHNLRGCFLISLAAL